MIDNQTAAPQPSKEITSPINLNTLDDDAIKSLISDGYKLLDRRKREREKAIKEQIKKLADSEGIKVSFRETTTRKKRGSTFTESN